MKKWLFNLTVVLVILMAASSAFAISEKEFSALLESSPELAEAERELNATWKEVTANLTDTQKNQLRQEQREWLKTGREETVTKVLNRYNGNTALAFAEASRQRSQELRISSSFGFSTAESPEPSSPPAKAPVSTNETPALKTVAQTIPSTATAAPAPSSPPAATDGKIYVEAEGLGQTKMEALNAAWMEAVRLGVGMFMTASTTMVDDKLTEQIVTHSRGTVNSYKILEEKKNAEGWHVRIAANIDRDILQETAAASQSKVITFDGQNMAAKMASDQARQKSAAELLGEVNGVLDFKDCLVHDVAIFQANRNGEPIMYAAHTLHIDPNKYLPKAQGAIKILDRVATSRKEYIFDNRDINEKTFSMLKNASTIHSKIKNIRLGYIDITSLIADSYTSSRMYNGKKIEKTGRNITEGVSIALNNAKFINYMLADTKILEKVPTYYTLRFYMESGEGFDGVATYTKNFIIVPGYNTTTNTFAPIVTLGTENYNLAPTPIVLFLQQLQLTPEQLTNLKSFKGGYTLEEYKQR